MYITGKVAWKAGNKPAGGSQQMHGGMSGAARGLQHLQEVISSCRSSEVGRLSCIRKALTIGQWPGEAISFLSDCKKVQRLNRFKWL